MTRVTHDKSNTSHELVKYCHIRIGCGNFILLELFERQMKSFLFEMF